MKRKLLIFSALISLLLAGFQFPIYADEDPSDTPSSVPIPNSIRLDQYFFDNYDLLTYIESDGSQIVDTGVYPNNNQRLNFKFSYFGDDNGSPFIANNNSGYNNSLYISFTNNQNVFYLYTGRQIFSILKYDQYSIHNVQIDRNIYSLDNLQHNFAEEEYSINTTYKLFNNRKVRVYSFSVYDYTSGEYIKYLYPAKSKSGGVIGLYDAVSDTFITTSGSVPFASPVDDQVMNFQISSFLVAGLGWIGDILEFAVETPIILIFMAICLAGAMFRWGRRLVHF